MVYAKKTFKKMKNFLIQKYNKFREWGWKYRKMTLHIVPETKY